jgi:LysM repeat protein
MKKIIVIIATLVLLQLLIVPASFAAPPAQQGGQQGRWNNCSGSCYIVQRGDTLYSIGRRFNVHPRYLAQVNQLNDPDYIYAGQMLRIPTDRRYPYPWWAHHEQLRPTPYDMGYGYDQGSGNWGDRQSGSYGGYPGSDYGAGQMMGNPMSGNGMMGPGSQYGGPGQMMGNPMSSDGMMGPGSQYGGPGQMMGLGSQYGGGGQMDFGGYNYGPGAGPQYLNAGQPGYSGDPAYDYSGSEN